MDGSRAARGATAVATAVVLVLTGCTGSRPAPEDASSSPGTATTPSASPSASPTEVEGSGPVVDDCLTGSWVLDVGDLRGRLAAWLEEQGTDVERLELDGGRRLDLTTTSLDVRSDLTTRVVVGGRASRWTDDGQGGGAMELSDGTLSVPRFSWRTRPEDPPADAPPLPVADWSRPVAWSCAPDGSLELTGEGSPVATRYERR